MQDGFIKNLHIDPISLNQDSSIDTPSSVGVTRSPGRDMIVENQEQDVARQIGDMTVYSYYMKSIGWPKATLLAGLCALAVFGSSFSRK